MGRGSPAVGEWAAQGNGDPQGRQAGRRASRRAGGASGTSSPFCRCRRPHGGPKPPARSWLHQVTLPALLWFAQQQQAGCNNRELGLRASQLFPTHAPRSRPPAQAGVQSSLQAGAGLLGASGCQGVGLLTAGQGAGQRSSCFLHVASLSAGAPGPTSPGIPSVSVEAQGSCRCTCACSQGLSERG